MNTTLRFLKDWTLPVSILIGTLCYMLFYYVPQLDTLGDTLGTAVDAIFPWMVFSTLFSTFCRIDFHQMRLHRWHIGVIATQLILIALIVWLILSLEATVPDGFPSGPITPDEATVPDGFPSGPITPDEATVPDGFPSGPITLEGSPLPYPLWMKLLLESLLTCIIGPAATAAPVVTAKIGGNINTMTAFVVLSSFVSALTIPAVFPLIERSAGLDFWSAFIIILQKLAIILLMPLALGWLIQHYAKRICTWIVSIPDLSFYLWAAQLSVTSGVTVRNIVHSQAEPSLLLMIALLSLILCFILFAIGRNIGRYLSDEINSGQGSFQKNTALSIWVAYTYLNPMASVGAGCYVLWQNIINSIELWQYRKKTTASP